MATVALFRLSLTIGVCLSILWAAAAHAQSAAGDPASCGPRSEIIKRLAGGFGEHTVAIGVADRGTAVIEVLASADGATWTVLYSMPSGVSCLVAAGQDWSQTKILGASEPST